MNNEPPKPDSGLQFDKAEFAQGSALNCAVCKTPITGEFYQANGQPVCPACQTGLKASLQLPMGVAVARSIGAGLAAAVVGFVVFRLVAMIVGGLWGIAAILTGWMVGYAVRWGSGGIGGPIFQGIAMVISYLAIVSSHLPWLLQSYDLPAALQKALASPWERGGIFTWVVFAFALYEAWSLNRANRLQISGPYTAARPA
jgi:hypothetical protein